MNDEQEDDLAPARGILLGIVLGALLYLIIGVIVWLTIQWMYSNT